MRAEIIDEPRVGRIMIVEDDPDLRAGLSEFLVGEGYAVDTAANGREALDQLRQAPLPSLIFLDLMMPVMSGQEFMEQQQRDPALRAIPVVVLSAAGAFEPREAATSVVASFIKPFDLEWLIPFAERYARAVESRQLRVES